MNAAEFPTPSPEQPLSVVVADDSPEHRIAMTAMLERAGFVVHAANDGAAAVALVRSVRPDAFVVDALMPVRSGFEAVIELRAQPEFATLPTIVVSGLEDVASRVRALTVGADDFVCKPADPSELVARILAQLRHRAAMAQSRPGYDPQQVNWLDGVITERRFDPHFQPIVDMGSGRVEALEALVRFHDGTSPLTALDTAAVLGRRSELELAILETVIDGASQLPADVLVHVNVSPATALLPELPAIVARSVRPIALEITENEHFGPAEAEQLRAALPAGTRIAADDVGAGFAGLVQLVGVRPDVIKIDREIISTIDTDPARQVVVAGLIEFATTTGADLVAEGIETAAEAEMVRHLGVRLGQGYYFGRPAPLFSSTAAAATPAAVAVA